MVETFLRFMSAFNLPTTRESFSFPWAIYRCVTANMKVIKIQPIPSEKSGCVPEYLWYPA